VILAALLGCGGNPTIGLAGPDPQDSAAELPSVPDDTAAPDDSGDTGKTDDDFGCSPLFAQDRLPVYEVTLEERDWHHLQTEWRTADGTKDYFPITQLLVDGEEVPNAELRLKGNSSCCWLGDKMQFVLAFNEIDEDARFEGERKIALDSPFYDPTVLKNRLASWYLLRQGLPAACTNSALLYVNGEFYGLYANMEELDHEFLERNFGKDNADGYLWKYGTELDNHEGEEIDYTRINDFWSSYDPAYTSTFGDVDQWMTEWAAEAVLPDGDGYWCCGHNYYLYDHPEQGMMWIPWDMDGTFDWVGYDIPPDYLYYPDYTPHMAYVLASDEGHAAFVEHIAAASDLYGTPEMLSALDDMIAQTAEWSAQDPYRYYDQATYETSLANLHPYVESRRAWLDAWLAAQPAP